MFEEEIPEELLEKSDDESKKEDVFKKEERLFLRSLEQVMSTDAGKIVLQRILEDLGFFDWNSISSSNSNSLNFELLGCYKLSQKIYLNMMQANPKKCHEIFKLVIEPKEE